MKARRRADRLAGGSPLSKARTRSDRDTAVSMDRQISLGLHYMDPLGIGRDDIAGTVFAINYVSKAVAERQHLTCRGLGYLDGYALRPADSRTGARTPPCVCRLFLPTIDARLITRDAATGKICSGFGDGRTVDLRRGIPNLQPDYYMVTSPPVVAKGVVIVGGFINDHLSVHYPSGIVRGFDAMSGQLLWNFDPGRPNQTSPLPPGHYYTAAPNNWAPGSVDTELGLVYLGLANQSPDQLGAGHNAEIERFSSAIVALDIGTGKLRWVFQAAHHDLWDRDIPS